MIKKQIKNNVSIVKISGGVSGEDAMRLSEEFGSVYKLDPLRVVVDLSETVAMDSSAMGVLVYWWKFLKQENRQLVLFNPHDAISEMLETTNLDKLLPIVDSFNTSDE